MAPSEASPPTPPVGRAYDGFLYDTDAPHVVVTASSSSPSSSSSAPIPPLRVVLPGTGNRPVDLSCLTRGVGAAAAEAGGDGGPTIALSYASPPDDAAAAAEMRMPAALRARAVDLLVARYHCTALRCEQHELMRATPTTNPNEQCPGKYFPPSDAIATRAGESKLFGPVV